MLAFLASAVLVGPASAQGEPETASGPSVTPQDPSGFIYGVVELRSKSYEGRLTFGRGDAFWNETVDSYKEDRPYLRVVPPEDRLRTVEAEVFGRKVSKTSRKRSSRGFSAPYGLIDRIEVHSHAWSSVLLRDGTELDLSGGRDLGSAVVVHGADGSETKVPWQRILRIRFAPTPADFPVQERRLYAKVRGTSGTYEGFLQWDRDEKLESETLDGDPVGGGKERNIPFADIARIEKIDPDSSRVTLKSGEVVELEGSNDVNHRIRGVWVHDSVWGRVGLDWQAFVAMELVPSPSSGPPYDAFAVAGPIRGTVRAAGQAHHGRIVFDVDESEAWETLDGDAGGVTYALPFDRIRSIERRPGDTCLVTLRDGNQIELGDGNDVGEGNDGLVMVSDAGTALYLRWSDVESLSLDGDSEEASSETP